ARTASVQRNALQAFPDLDTRPAALAEVDLLQLTDDGELDLLKRLALYPDLIVAAARAHEPHRLAFYLYDLASAFHGHWTRGNDSPHLRVIQTNDRGLTAARCALVSAVQSVLFSGLSILGVGAPESMR